MKNSYYKLNIKGNCFWQSNNGIYTQKDYNPDNELLDTIYFKSITGDIYQEVLTSERIVLDNRSRTHFVYPRGVITDTSKLTPCSLEEMILRFDKIKKNSLNKDYMKVLTEYLKSSHYCDMASEKKEENMQMKKHFGLY